jgi:hypothetical protein
MKFPPEYKSDVQLKYRELVPRNYLRNRGIRKCKRMKTNIQKPVTSLSLVSSRMDHRTKKPIQWLFVIALLCTAETVHSQPAVSFGQYTLGGGWNGMDQVQGWEFVPRVDVTVVALGLYDGRTSGGFQQDHTIAIWNGNGGLITSAPVPAGESAPLQQNFRYVDISSTVLHQGQTYVIGAFLPGPVTDYTTPWERSALDNGIVNMDPRIEFVAYRAGLSPGSISFPESRWVDYVGGFGPSFIMTVPEPSSFALFLIAGALWRFYRFGRARAADMT